MASSSNINGPNTGPQPDRWYNLSLGSSFKDDHPSSKFCTLRYEFKPASIDKNQPGTMHKSKDNKVTVEFNNNQVGKPKVVFEGSSEDYKENDAVLFFDGESFRLERLHRAVKRMRHLRVPGESAVSAMPVASSVGPAAEAASPPLPKVPKVQPSSRTTVPTAPTEAEKVEIGGTKSPDKKTGYEKIAENPSDHANLANEYSVFKNDDLEEEVDILMDDDDVAADESGGAAANGVSTEKEFDTGIDINIPQRNDTDDEIADVDVSVSDGEVDKCVNAADFLRAQVNAAGEEQSSSASSSSGSDSSGSGSASGSGSGSGSGSDSESSDADSIHSI